MPIIKSAKKRVKIAAKATARNAKAKRAMREAIKSFQKALEGGKAADIVKAEQAAISSIDMAAKKAVIHKNKASRRKSQIARAAKAHGVKHGKTPAKKVAPKAKSPAKKPAAKKTATKK
jgi:small subunit ribosomal protein S20